MCNFILGSSNKETYFLWHVGIDLHRATIVLAAVNDRGRTTEPVSLCCEDTATIVAAIRRFKTFRAVVEATGTYRWLYDLLRPYGTILLAHSIRLHAMIQSRSKTDKLDTQLLANLLRINQILLAYIPPEPYRQLRDLTRCRALLARDQVQVKTRLRGLLGRLNRQLPFHEPFGPRGLAWFRRQDFGRVENIVRDELLAKFEHFRRQIAILD